MKMNSVLLNLGMGVGFAVAALTVTPLLPKNALFTNGVRNTEETYAAAYRSFAHERQVASNLRPAGSQAYAQPSRRESNQPPYPKPVQVTR